jgi:hypothetical protein
MNDPHDMGNRPVAPSVSPLARQAARNLHRLELVSQTPTWNNCFFRLSFWRIQRIMVMTPDEAAAWLPALAITLHQKQDCYVLDELVGWPLPEPLPPEALPWRAALIQGWEQYPAATGWETSLRLFALVRLDRRAERLPEWLTEARQSLDLEWYHRHFRLAALAGWRPRPGDAPPHMGSTGVAQAWVRFWEERYRTPGSELDGLIAAAALLHLAEAGWLPYGPSPERLREEFHQWMQQWSVSTYQDMEILRILLSSVPADASTPEQQQQDIMKWLELTHRNVPREKREAVWGMLAAWQREGVLERCGIGRGRLPEPPRLLPDLARALEWEQDRDVLQAMAGYVPGLAEVRDHPEAMRAVVAHWETRSRDGYWDFCLAAWVSRWNLRRAGVLTAEEQGRFDADDVEAIRAEDDPDVLLALAQITPPGTFPLAIWTRRLSDQDDRCRLAARLAIHGWLVDMAGGGQRRQVRQALRRAGQEGAGNRLVAPFVNLPPEVLPDFRRLHEIETALAAGHLPPSPDAGMENRPAPHAVPARLPEAHPRTGPPGITDRTAGRTAGSEPPARRPFPEAGRHE